MKRDDDYIRGLLLHVEESDDPVIVISRAISPSDEEKKLAYHVKLLSDAGLMTPESHHAYRLTNQGHDYLEAIRQDTIWKKTKEGAAAVGGASLGMMKDIALAYLRQQAKGVLGIDFS